MPDRSVVALDIGVLLGLTGLNVLDRDAPFLGPDQQLATDVFRAVVDPYGVGLSTPFDDPVKAPDHALSGQREVDLDAQPFPVEVVKATFSSRNARPSPSRSAMFVGKTVPRTVF